MAKILVSLISDQTIQNVIFIKHFSGIDRHVFVTTAEMEKSEKWRSKWIENAANITADRIPVIEDDIANIEQALQQKINIVPEDEIIINLTGGTKIMAIGVYNFFQHHTNQIYYIPIGKNSFRCMVGSEKGKDTVIDYRVSVEEYLKSYGITFTTKKPIKSDRQAFSFFQKFINADSTSLEIIERLRVHWRGKKKKVNLTDIEQFEEATLSEQGKRIPQLREWLQSMDFQLDSPEIISDKEIDYLTGGWFEEYVYFKIRESLGLGDSQIALGVVLKKDQNVTENDLDVVFTLNNALHVIECKTAMSEDGKTSSRLFNETVYKASALRKYFGLVVNSYLFTLSDLQPKDNNSPNYPERAEVLGIKTVDRGRIIQSDVFVNFLKSLKR
jgi:hypothetical protein